LPEGSTSIQASSPRYSASFDDADDQGKVRVCPVAELPLGEVVRLDAGDQTFAIYRTAEDQFYATEGICTHGNAHLADGMVIGDQIECPKHNGRFRLSDGSPQRPPVCEAIKTFAVEVKNEEVYFDLTSAAERGLKESLLKFRVVSNRNVATFIKELVLEPVEEISPFTFLPGDYLKLEIPPHETPFSSFIIEEPYASTWRDGNIFHHHSFNSFQTRRNYSLASNPGKDSQWVCNVRLALPPLGIDCYAGIGSSYVFSLKEGDLVTATGPYGEFHIRDSEREMVYVGGGAGMAPLRSHISHLFETLHTTRRVWYWYGARSEDEMYYLDYFLTLEKQHSNFSFHRAYSEIPAAQVPGVFSGMIHEILHREFLEKCTDAPSKEYYLCGPPEMVKAVKGVLLEYQVPESRILFDEF
jgi:Na(+)-translocating NADH:ubiquinone oxidoreductase F subunit